MMSTTARIVDTTTRDTKNVAINTGAQIELLGEDGAAVLVAGEETTVLHLSGEFARFVVVDTQHV